jgi:hypothetical protein
MRFDPQISALEERSDLNSISMDELHGIFTAYEMSTEHKNIYIKKHPSKNPKCQSKREGKNKKIATPVMSRKIMKKWPTLSKD